MRIRRSQLVPYRLPLARPLAVRADAGGFRDGALLMVESEGGAPGFGDVAPLTGVSRETLEEAIADVHRETARLSGMELSADAFLQGKVFSEEGIHPSACFAIESAWLGAMASEAGLPLAAVFSDDVPAAVRVNGLIDGDPDTWMSQAAEAMASGISCVKIKVGRDGWEREGSGLRALHESVGGGLSLRLDANRAWTLDTYLRFAEGVAGVSVVYIEEPVQGPEDLALAIRQGGLPVALDESLYDQSPSCLDAYAGAAAVVLKPSRVGGLVAAWKWAREARVRGMSVTISSLFESGAGLRALIQLAAALGHRETAHGLDTAGWFAEDVVDPRVFSSGGCIPVEGPEDSLLLLNRNVVRDTR